MRIIIYYNSRNYLLEVRYVDKTLGERVGKPQLSPTS
jgi:hypothetical protein